MPESSLPHRLLARLRSLWGGAYAVVERDFLVTTSTRRFLALRLGVALIAAVVVAIVAMANANMPPDAVGRTVMVAAVVVVPLLVLLISPATAAPAISTEREGATLDLVMAAPVSAGTFVLAKFLARLLNVGVLVFAMLPVAATCFLFGGVAVDTFLALVAFSLSLAAFCVATGLLFSSYLRSPAAAVLGAFLFVVLAPPAPFALLGVLHESGIPIDSGTLEELLPALHYFAWGELAQAAERGNVVPDACWYHVLVSSVLTAGLLALAVRRMRREGHVTRKARRARLSSGLFLGHPLLDRHVRGSLLWHPRKRGFVVPGIALIGDVILLWAGALENQLDEAWIHVAALGSLTVLGMLHVLTSTSASIASERQRGSLELVMATPFRPRQIAFAALAGGLMSTAPLFALGMLHGTIAALFGSLHVAGVLAWAVSSAVLLVAVGALGLRISSIAGTPTKAALWAFGTFFGAMVLAGLVAFILAMLRVDESVAASPLLSLPPVVAYYVPWFGHAVAERVWYRYDDIAEFVPLASLAGYVALSIVFVRQAIVVLERRGD